MTYEEWNPRPHRVLLRDPNNVLRWVSVTDAIGVKDAGTKALLEWPEATVVVVTGGGSDGD